jgi:large subunit ribosomal protein L24
MKIKKGDKVKVISGKDKGREGTVNKVYMKQNKILLPGINLYKKHIKKNEKMPQGGVVEIPRLMTIAKVMLICPKCNRSIRVSYQIENGRKYRFCKKCKSRI